MTAAQIESEPRAGRDAQRATMRAVVYERYGSPDVMELREVPRPAPRESEVLVRVHASGVGAGDVHLLTAEMFAVRLYQGIFRPKRRILGYDVAGTVEAVGAGVTRFRPGDEVFGESTNGGTFAEYVCVPESGLAPKPARLTFEEAAAVPVSALTALQGLRDKGRIQAGHKVLIHGASGGVGTFAVQIAKSFGAQVTGTCSAEKMDLVRTLGADHVLDYAETDFTEREERYDLVLDNVGRHSVRACKRVLTPTGIYVAVSGAVSRTLGVALFGGKRAVTFVSKPKREDLEFLGELLDAGKIRPAVDRTYALSEAPEALRRLSEGQVRGKVVVTVSPRV